jgi:mannose/fructose/N-acetylgalactosamine-specific phosphotransferase system component IID
MSLITDLRQAREPFLHTSVFDTGGTILIGYLLAERFKTSKPATIIGLLIVGHLTHKVLRIETQLNAV